MQIICRNRYFLQKCDIIFTRQTIFSADDGKPFRFTFTKDKALCMVCLFWGLMIILVIQAIKIDRIA